MIFIVKGQDEIYLASEQAGVDVMVICLDQPKSTKLCKNLYVHFCQYYWINVRQCEILCWKVFSNADSSVLEAFRKLGHVPLEDRTKNALEQYICLIVSQEEPLTILLG